MFNPYNLLGIAAVAIVTSVGCAYSVKKTFQKKTEKELKEMLKTDPDKFVAEMKRTGLIK